MAMKQKSVSNKSPAAQIAGFIAKFDPQLAGKIRTARQALRKRFPTAYELVYDNYNFLVFGFCSTERPSSAIISLTANAKGMGICFIHGKKLPDPDKLLLGSGNQTRFIRLENAAVLANPPVEALLRAAVAQAKPPLPASGRGRTIIRLIAPKQRPRRS